MPETPAGRRPSTRSAQVVITVRAHWSAAWLLRWAARPAASVDGRDLDLAWGRERVVRLTPGVHAVEAFARYRPVVRGAGPQRPAGPQTGAVLRLRLAAGDDVRVTFRNTWVTAAPFTARISDPRGAWTFDAGEGVWRGA